MYGLRRRRWMASVGLVLLVSAGMTASTTNAASGVQVVRGWAGYVVRAGSGSFDGVHGRWVQPRVVCNRPGSSAAFWIGLGGATRHSRALEQVGTSADCSDRAQLSYSAWYQLWPARAVELPVAVRAGDLLDAAVSVDGGVVTVALRNVSTGAAVTKEIVMWEPETDSAEWIVEAPALCLASCALLPLATFRSVTFTDTAATLSTYTGMIGDPRWTRSRFTIGVPRGRMLARASSLLEGGSSFRVVRSRY
jgi:hypothetical protein